MFGPLTPREMLKYHVNIFHQGHVDTFHQPDYGGYVNASPPLPTPAYEGFDIRMDSYQNSEMQVQEQPVMETPAPEFEEFVELESMSQMADIPYDAGLNEVFISQAMSEFFGTGFEEPALENMMDDPDFDMGHQLRFDPF